jgi:hypothetical protein
MDPRIKAAIERGQEKRKQANTKLAQRYINRVLRLIENAAAAGDTHFTFKLGRLEDKDSLVIQEHILKEFPDVAFLESNYDQDTGDTYLSFKF